MNQVRAEPRPYPPSAVGNGQRRRLIERSQALAKGLQTFRPEGDLPQPLWETAYLLAESQNPQRPLLERLRILGLMDTSLDQFFVEQLVPWQEKAATDPQGAQRLYRLSEHLSPMLDRASALLHDEILPELAARYSFVLCTPADLTAPERDWLRRFFQARVYPLLTPLAVDPGHPFPFISSFSLNFMVYLRAGDADRAWQALTYARLKVPGLLPQFIQVLAEEGQSGRPGQGKPVRYLPGEEVVRCFLPELFPGFTVENAFLFRVVRAADVSSPTELPAALGIRQRQMALPVVRLDVETTAPDHLLNWLVDHLQVPPYACFRVGDHLGQVQLVHLANLLEGLPA